MKESTMLLALAAVNAFLAVVSVGLFSVTKDATSLFIAFICAGSALVCGWSAGNLPPEDESE